MNETKNNNQLPKDWKWVKLGDAIQVLDNLRKPINSSERQRRIAGKTQKELFPYYGATGQVGWIDSFITNGEYVLVGEDGAPFLDNFKEKAYKINGKTWVNNHAHILQQLEGVTINDFILHYLNSINYRNYVNGTTRLKLTKGSLIEIPFPVPSIKTQLAIVSKIEELFSELDKGIEQLKTAQQQLKTYRQSVLKWAFEGKLTNNLNFDLCDLDDYNDLNIAAETEVEYKSKKNQGNQNIQINHSSDKGKLPEGWRWVKINEIGKIKGGKRLPPRHQYSEEPTEFIYIMAGNLKDGTVKNRPTYLKKETYDALANYKVMGGEVYITIVGACIGDAGLIPEKIGRSILTENAAKIIDLKGTINKYLALWINSTSCQADIKTKILSATLGKLALNRIGTLEVPLPPVEEQNKIVQEIESRLSVADKMEESINQSLRQAEALRQSILKKAFEGKLV